jgi:hypothetical protein
VLLHLQDAVAVFKMPKELILCVLVKDGLELQEAKLFKKQVMFCILNQHLDCELPKIILLELLEAFLLVPLSLLH